MSVNIRQKRAELKLTLEEIGNYVGVSKSTVKKWENGNIKHMRRDKILLLSEILRVSPLDFLSIGTHEFSEYNRPLTAELTFEDIKKIEDAISIPLPEAVVLFKINDKYILRELSPTRIKTLLDFPE